MNHTSGMYESYIKMYDSSHTYVWFIHKYVWLNSYIMYDSYIFMYDSYKICMIHTYVWIAILKKKILVIQKMYDSSHTYVWFIHFYVWMSSYICMIHTYFVWLESYICMIHTYFVWIIQNVWIQSYIFMYESYICMNAVIHFYVWIIHMYDFNEKNLLFIHTWCMIHT